jgi:hypothetical protein
MHFQVPQIKEKKCALVVPGLEPANLWKSKQEVYQLSHTASS